MSTYQQASSEEKPTFLFDADCGFCIGWIDYFERVAGEKVVFRPYQNAAHDFPSITKEAARQAVHFVEPEEGRVTTGAEATFRMLSYNPRYRAWIGAYKFIPGFAWLAEWWYQLVAKHRGVFEKLTQLLIGVPIKPTRYYSLRWIFLRLLGAIYFIAFASLGVQVIALIGENGILPAQLYLDTIANSIGRAGLWRVPSIFWISATNAALVAGIAAGIIASLGIMVRVFERTSLVVSFVMYLSFVSIGQVFMNYQWDALLLEVGFVATFFSFLPWFIWVLRLILFKFILMSGIGKLASGDETWQDLTALTYHYVTQPLPTPIGWYMHQLPVWFHQLSAFLTLAIQIGVPFLFFFPRRIRFAAAWVIIALEVMIFLTGNYTFFNILTIALALLLFDDQALEFVLPRRLIRWLNARAHRDSRSRYVRWAGIGVVLLLVAVHLLPRPGTTESPVGRALEAVPRAAAPFRIANGYGLFTTMTTTRPEIILQGSRDGEVWQTYTFRYKPDDPHDVPPVVAPHHPRLDWQMWFAGLYAERELVLRRQTGGTGQLSYPFWFQSFVVRLLENEPSVTALLEENPFPESPPRFIRAMVYDYTFSSWGDDGWWKAGEKQLYLPPSSLSSM